MSVERQCRQLLADKVSGTLVGLWFLVAEHLRLGTWDLLKRWSGVTDDAAVEPRLALQMVHESALCLTGLRAQRSLRQKGFEALNGLPFVASDQAIHCLLDRHTVAEATALQDNLACLRRGQGHYAGKLVLIDPHRVPTTTRRQIPLKQASHTTSATKNLQIFFALDAHTWQPMGFGIGSPSVTASSACIDLVARLQGLLSSSALIAADSEHCTEEVLGQLRDDVGCSVLVPMPKYSSTMRLIRSLNYTRQWAGYAVAEGTYRLRNGKNVRLLAQRCGERPDEYVYKPFATTSTLAAADLMTLSFPERWNIEEFFNMEQGLGWDRASTLNLNIRYARLSFTLMTQALIYGLRQQLPQQQKAWTAEHLANKLFMGIDGDVRVRDDTIIVTLYNAPQDCGLRNRYENLPTKLQRQGIDPRVPWIYGFKVDFRFK